jgi:hypothetical protein
MPSQLSSPQGGAQGIHPVGRQPFLLCSIWLREELSRFELPHCCQRLWKSHICYHRIFTHDSRVRKVCSSNVSVLSAYSSSLHRQGVLPYPEVWASTKPFGTPTAPYLLKWGLSILMILAPPAGDAFNFSKSPFPIPLILLV